MPAESVDVVRRVYDAAARRDAEAVFSLYDRDVEWDGRLVRWAEVIPGDAHFHGHDELRGFFRLYYEMWDSFEDELQELVDLGDQVMSVVTSRGRGRTSGVDVVWEGNAGVWTIREGKVVRVVWYPSREEALAATGHSPG